MASRMSGSIKMARKRAIRTDGRKMFDDVRFECVQDTRKRGNAFEQYTHQIMVDQSGGSSSIDLVLVFSFLGYSDTYCHICKLQNCKREATQNSLVQVRFQFWDKSLHKYGIFQVVESRFNSPPKTINLFDVTLREILPIKIRDQNFILSTGQLNANTPQIKLTDSIRMHMILSRSVLRIFNMNHAVDILAFAERIDFLQKAGRNPHHKIQPVFKQLLNQA